MIGMWEDGSLCSAVIQLLSDWIEMASYLHVLMLDQHVQSRVNGKSHSKPRVKESFPFSLPGFTEVIHFMICNCKRI